MPANISSLGALQTDDGSTAAVLPVESWGLTPGIMETIHFHSGNMSPTQIVVPGAEQRIMASIPFKIAFQTFGFGVSKLTTMNAFMSRFIDYLRDPDQSSQLNLTTDAVCAAQVLNWSVNVDGILMANVELVPLAINSDDSPLEFDTPVSLPALTGSPELHTLGPITITTVATEVAIPGLIASSGAINGNLDVRRSDGDRYPRIAARYTVQPTINMDHSDPLQVLSDLGLLGIRIGGTVSASAYFRAYDPTTGIVNAANSVKIAIALGRLTPTSVNNQQGAISTSGLTLTGITADNDTNPLTVTLNATAPDAG